MSDTWWRGAAIYQVYLRSFADGNGDGIGDLAGLRARLPYLADLGVDAVWFNPWYPSPMADGGYDVADYRDIDPVFGTLAEAEELIREAHELGIRIIIDVVPNHSSDRARLVPGGAGRRARLGRARPVLVPPGAATATAANDWQSIFGGPAWTQVARRRSGTCTCSPPSSPTSTGTTPRSAQEFEDVLRFWFDRGVDGVRIDSAAAARQGPGRRPDREPHPYTDRDEVHDDLPRAGARIADAYGEPRSLIGEVWLPDQERFARYLRPDELHTAFNFDFLACPWDAGRAARGRSTRRSPRTPRSAPRRPGCCPTTT